MSAGTPTQTQPRQQMGTYGQQTPFRPTPYQGVQFKAPSLSPIQALQVPQQQFQLMSQMGQEQIGRGAQRAQQDLMRQMTARGLGQSGLQMQAAADLYQRGAGQQMSDLARSLASQRMGLEFGEAQTARAQEAQRQYQQAGFGMDIQKMMEEQMRFGRQQPLSEALALADVGMKERTQTAQEQNALMQALSGLGQSFIGAQAQQGGGGKGGK